MSEPADLASPNGGNGARRSALSTFANFDWTTGARPYALLTLLCFFALLPGIARLAPVDRDEARFMQATKQMVESGDYGRILFQDLPRDKKPPGAHWLQAGVVNTLAGGDTGIVAAYRLPSVVAVWLAVMLIAGTGRRALAPGVGLAAGAILATMTAVVVETHLAKADAPLLLCATICFAALLAAYTAMPAQRLPPSLVGGFWLALGAGVLVKGPIILAVVALPIAALAAADRRVGWLAALKPAVGAPLALAVLAIWPLVSGWDEVLRFSGAAAAQDLWPKLVAGIEDHGAPPGTHAVAALVTLWPWAFLVPATLFSAWRARGEPVVRFCLAWIGPFWLLLEIVPTKLPHYPLPVLPALALLIGAAVCKARTRAAPAEKLPRAVSSIAVAAHIALCGVFLVTLALIDTPGAFGTIPILSILALAVLAAMPLAAVSDANLTRMATRTAFAATVFYAATFRHALPETPSLNVSARLAAAVRAASPDGDADIALVGYHEPSAVFLLGTPTQLTDAAGGAAVLADRPGALVAVTAEDLPVLARTLSARGGKIERIAEISGYNYGRGEAVTLILLRRKSSPMP
ncbi:MAG: glycosyltransferase family 39 protein [Rhodospirillaceae bacterium]|nr:glycosyltransferase family 39 protein [Rhodospirillaceae bacterium]